MTLADKLNAAGIYPNIELRDRTDAAVDRSQHGIEELGCYSPYPMSDAKVYVRTTTEEAQWTERGWIDRTPSTRHSGA